MERRKLNNLKDLNTVLESDLTPTDKVILCKLILYRNHKTGRCFPKQSALAEDLSLGIRTVNRSISTLKKAGVLTTSKRNTHAPLDYEIDVTQLTSGTPGMAYQYAKGGVAEHAKDGVPVTPRVAYLCNKEGTKKEPTKNINKGIQEEKEDVSSDVAVAPSLPQSPNKKYRLEICNCGSIDCEAMREKVEEASEYDNKIRIRAGLLYGQLQWKDVLDLGYTSEDFSDWPEIASMGNLDEIPPETAPKDL